MQGSPAYIEANEDEDLALEEDDTEEDEDEDEEDDEEEALDDGETGGACNTVKRELKLNAFP